MPPAMIDIEDKTGLYSFDDQNSVSTFSRTFLRKCVPEGSVSNGERSKRKIRQLVETDLELQLTSLTLRWMERTLAQILGELQYDIPPDIVRNVTTRRGCGI